MNYVAYDTETTSLRRHTGDMFSFSLCDEEGKSSVHRLDGSLVRQRSSRTTLEKLWKDKNTAKVMHNAKFDLGFTQNLLNDKLEGQPIHDTSLMSKILQNHHPSHDLKDLAWELANVKKDDERAIKPFTRGGASYQNVPEQLMTEYQHQDAQRTMLLFLFFWPKIQASPLFLDIYQNELDLLPVTIDMENRGVMLHRPKCHVLIAKLQNDANTMLDQIEKEAGWHVNPNKRGDLEKLLFQDLGFSTPHKTKTGLPSLEKETLMELKVKNPRCRILDLVLQFRSWARGVSTITGYLNRAGTDDVLHPNISTCEAITGREACSDPNLQNVEKVGVLLNPYPVPARKVFRPRPGYVNFHIDYSGIEMRLLVHYSGEKSLVKIINENGDVHLPAAKIFFPDFDSKPADLQKVLRNSGKAANFAIGYGAAIPKIAEILMLPLFTAAQRYAFYKATFPRLCALLQTYAQQVKQTGQVVTAFGRVLHVPRGLAHTGINYLIQGTAAEILKRGQVETDRYLKKETSNEMRLLLPIHDELIIECPRNRLKDARSILRKVSELMVDFPGKFRVPLAVEVDVATVDWAHKSKFPLTPAA